MQTHACCFSQRSRVHSIAFKMETYRCPVVPLEVTQLKFSSIEVFLDQAIGEGRFGHTYRAKCDQLPCAAKVLQVTGATEEEILPVEIACQLLSAIRHPNIVQCLGTARWGYENHPIILLEEMDENLAYFLERQSSEKSLVPYYVKVNILCDVAFGVAYLHRIDVVHGNLTANNILIVGESRAKITDFWMLKIANMHPAMHSDEVDSSKMIYMALETLSQPPLFSQQSDIYSFGVITVLVDTQKTPALDPHMEPRKSFTSKMKPASRLVKLASECLESDPSARLELEGLCRDLVSLKKEAPYVTDRQESRGECGRLKRHLLAHEREIQECQMKLKSKEEDNAGMKMVIAKLERAVLDASKENGELAKKNEEHKLFERHLLRNSSATSPHYRTQLFTPQSPTDEPDSTMTMSPTHSDTEIHRVSA